MEDRKRIENFCKEACEYLGKAQENWASFSDEELMKEADWLDDLLNK
ncbi:hypothetical protein [Bacillus toyonensis]|nr:hypothetical protein [Bacillus toyonensis]